MCLAVAMRVREVQGWVARCEARGVEREASLLLLEGVVPGDYVAVHLGHAVARMSEEEAERAWALFDRMLAEGPL